MILDARAMKMGWPSQWALMFPKWAGETPVPVNLRNWYSYSADEQWLKQLIYTDRYMCTAVSIYICVTIYSCAYRCISVDIHTSTLSTNKLCTNTPMSASPKPFDLRWTSRMRTARRLTGRWCPFFLPRNQTMWVLHGFTVLPYGQLNINKIVLKS